MGIVAEFRKTMCRLYQVKEHLLPSDSVLFQLMLLLTSMLLFWRAWETVEPHHVTNWSDGHGERVGCQPACPHELHPYMPVNRPHHSSQTQNLLWVNGLKLCLGVCEPLHVCSHRPSASSGRFQAQLSLVPPTVALWWCGQPSGTWRVVWSSPILGSSVLRPLLSSSQSDGPRSVFNDLTGIFASTMGY